MWKNIPEAEGYQISDDGELGSCWRFKGAGYGGKCCYVKSDVWKILNPHKSKSGYLRTALRVAPNTFKQFFIHNLVLLAFVGSKPFRHHACHNNGNKLDNRLSNLRWDTPRQNAEDKRQHKTLPMGESHACSKLNDKDVIFIRRQVAEGKTCAAMGRMFGVTTANISNIVLGKTWKSVGGPIQN